VPASPATTVAVDASPTAAGPRGEDLLAALDEDQRAVAMALTGPVCVLAGAGTGKTRAITYRIAHGVRSGVYRPGAVLAVTFTARAAGELRSRLRDLGVPGVQARTFHSAALRQLSYFWPSVVGGSLPRLVEHKAPLVAEAASRLGLDVDRVVVRDLAGEIEWAKVSLVTADDYVRAAADADRGTVAGYDSTVLARLLPVYEDVKTERGVIDFEDVLLLTVGVLAERTGVAETVRQQYRHFVVDEYQDVSPLQQRLLDLWLGERQDLCVVGDASQTIYSFTGATPRYLVDFPRRYPGAEVVRLVRDYRSTPQVVALANRVLKRGRSSAAVELVAQRPPGPQVRFDVYDDDMDEARGVAERIRGLLTAGVQASEIAVLYRTNAQSEAVEQALADAGIGYVVRGGERFFARREVRDAVVLLRGAMRAPVDRSMPEVVREVLGAAGWSPTPPDARGATREKWESLSALVALADDLAATRGADLAGLVEELDERATAQHAPTVQGVALASLHAAKGLEWDAVFIVGVCEGLLPISMAERDDAVAEERRLLYVGITRAREQLTLSYARARIVGGRAVRRPSRFLDGIWPDERSAARRGRAARHRAPGGDENDGVDQETFERLRTWRATVAQETARPAYTVLHDTTLAAIAAAKPRELRQLALIRGIGAAKLDQYGPAVLALVRGERPPPASTG
jgi:DNA helicase-2/ATP-dependent DNA helicase PcrA